MDLQFLGATDTVTGSKYLLREGGATVLVDCGLFQGYKQLRLRNWTPLPVPAASIDAVDPDPCALDHSGYVPLLARQGFRGKVYCTPATHDLCRILLTDSGHLLEEEAEYLNRHQLSKHAPALPLYTREDALRCLKLFHPVDYGHGCGSRHRACTPACPRPATCWALPSSTSTTAGASLLFSGDLGRPHDPVLKPPARMPGADYLVVESTYGDRLHERNRPAAAARRRHQPHVGARRRGGDPGLRRRTGADAAALPSSVLKERGAIHALPVYLNSPMAASATRCTTGTMSTSCG